MLTSHPAKHSLVVCSTCRFSKKSPNDPGGTAGGALFAAALSTVLEGHPCRDRVQIQSMPCLFACGSHCTVYLRSEGRWGYILGGFSPVAADSRALLDYVDYYLRSGEGVVPYESWPEGVKGHFLVRVPPDGHLFEPPPPSVPDEIPD